MDIQQLINEVVAKLRELYAALGEQRTKVGAAITALTDQPMPDESQEVAALTSEVKTSVDDIEASVRESQQP